MKFLLWGLRGQGVKFSYSGKTALLKPWRPPLTLKGLSGNFKNILWDNSVSPMGAKNSLGFLANSFLVVAWSSMMFKD